MFRSNKIQHIILAAVGALVFSTASVGAAVGPAELKAAAQLPMAGVADQARA